MVILVTVSAPPLIQSKPEIIEHGLVGIKTSAIAIRPQYGDVLRREIQQLSKLHFALPDLLFCPPPLVDVRKQVIPTDNVPSGVIMATMPTMPSRIRRALFSLSRRTSSTRLRSSMSVFVPYHLMSFPDSSRSGTARLKYQRYEPRAVRVRISHSYGSPVAKAACHFSAILSMSSG